MSDAAAESNPIDSYAGEAELRRKYYFLQGIVWGMCQRTAVARNCPEVNEKLLDYQTLF